MGERGSVVFSSILAKSFACVMRYFMVLREQNSTYQGHPKIEICRHRLSSDQMISALKSGYGVVYQLKHSCYRRQSLDVYINGVGSNRQRKQT